MIQISYSNPQVQFNRGNIFLLTPSQCLPGKHENTSSNASRHVSNSLSVCFSSRAFKGYFLSPKKTIRKQTGSAWNFLQRSIQLCRGAYNQRPYFLLLHLFRRMSQSSGQMLNEHTIDYHPSSSEFTSRIQTLIFL